MSEKKKLAIEQQLVHVKALGRTAHRLGQYGRALRYAKQAGILRQWLLAYKGKSEDQPQ